MRNLVPKLPLTAICACVLLGILVAGLWPFHAPRNDVSWLSDGNGLLFGKHGSIASARPLEADMSQTDNSCSLEIWLEPSQIDSKGMVVAFYWPTSKIVSFALRQYQNGLVLERESRGHANPASSIYVGNVFRGPKPVLVTISSGEAGTAVYVDGTLVRSAPDFKLVSRDLSGEFVVGSSPVTPYYWSGQVKGIAIYDRGLNAGEVLQDYASWTGGWAASGRKDAAKSEGVIARYLFDEGKGNVVHNQVDSATNLLIPERFFILHEQFLERPWDEFHPVRSYWKDVGINVAGFIPLGFFFQMYFSVVGGAKRATRLTIALGFAVSLTIEVLQSFLPTRQSGMTDLFTNTLGTALGAMVCAWVLKRHELT
jgi:hypothetical protein